MSSETQLTTTLEDNQPEKVVVISHSPLFYWWPVWAVGFVLALLSYTHGYQVAFVPPGTVAERGAQVKGHEGPRDVLIAPAGQSLPQLDDQQHTRLRMLVSNDPGIIWAATLCLVIVLSQVHLRGLWSFVVIIVLFFVTVLLAILELWDPILQAVRVIDIHITAFSYLSISLFLFVVWLITFVFFDRQVYMVFTRGQLRVRKAVSQGETVFDTRGMVVKRHRDDLIRHWLLGFGSGDLTVSTGGANPQQFEWPNVLRIGSKLRLIHTMLQEREVVRGSR